MEAQSFPECSLCPAMDVLNFQVMRDLLRKASLKSLTVPALHVCQGLSVHPEHDAADSRVVLKGDQRLQRCDVLSVARADGRGRRSPSLGADLAALFPTLGSLEGRQVISQLGNGGVPSASDTPPRSAASSLDRILSDLGSSDVLDEHK